MISRRSVSAWPAVLAALLACAGLGIALASALQGGNRTIYVVAVALVLAPFAVALAVWLEPSVAMTIGLMLSMFSGNWEHLGVPVPPDRVMLLIGLLGIAVRARDHHEYRPRLLPVHGVLAIAGLYATASALWAGTLYEHSPLFALLDRFALIAFVLFVVAPVAFRTERQRSHLLAGLVVLGAYLGVTACAQGLGLDALVFPPFILDPSIGHHVDRARGPFLEASSNGLALFACAVAAAMAAGRWRGLGHHLALAIGVLCLLGILFTLTRQVWLGAVVGSLVGIAVTARLRAYAVPLILSGFLLVLVAYTVVPGLRERAGTRAASRWSVWDRLNSDRAALRMVADRPLLGFGWGRFGRESQPYYSVAPEYPLTQVPALHNVILSHTVELGLIGAALWATALLMALAGALLRRGPPELEPWRRGLLAIAVCWLLVINFTPLGFTFSNYLLWVWAGLAGAAGVRGRAAPPEAEEPPAWLREHRRAAAVRRRARRQPASSL